MTAERVADVLIIGAGPYGLSLASRLRHLGVDYRIAGEPMSFWRHHMPVGMFLRSSWDWHLDPQDELTIERFMAEEGITREQLTPFPISTYLDYVEWFRSGSDLRPEPLRIERLDRDDDGIFRATSRGGTIVAARTVVLALGFSSFAHVPEDLSAKLPNGVSAHTLDFVDFSQARGKSVLIVGGRQSAFEWAALLAEAGAGEIHISHRHPSPAFAESDWTWVLPLMQNMVANPGWFRSLPQAEQRDYFQRLWVEGRLKVEPWLEPRIRRGPVTVRAETEIVGSNVRSGRVIVELSDSTQLDVDVVVLATGYKADIARIEFLSAGNLNEEIEVDQGLPVLGERFQSSVPGLYMTSLLATREFGPFVRFTVAAPAAATILGDELARIHASD